ncbi:formimidoylglutamase [Ectobacillus ponti]|uniref:Formimidoylglutamase n=1 Tax=Ectobacillus ponti TaxID=2961894 RepID=A0AA42BPG9_9BACI|nr:formimidoylglutamase [Ectobacillus ponti]MCP8969115.1 formimidoylglutamase [Ectobacillus ponti]
MRYLNKQAKFMDRYVRKWSGLVQEWDGSGTIGGPALIGAPLAKASISHSGAHLAPRAIRSLLDAYSVYRTEEDRDVQGTLHDCGDIVMHVTDVAASQQRIYETVRDLLRRHQSMLPILLGGDHSISYPGIRAFAEERGKIGVIVLDAHHDLRNLEDGGPSNGTSFRSLLANGIVEGSHLHQIGIRNYANARAYHEYAKEQGVHVYTMGEVERKGADRIVAACLQSLRGKVDAVYVSLDMDVLDQAFAPGCPAIGPGGMDSRTFLQFVQLLAAEELVQGLDIVEIDPTLDVRDMTSRLAAHALFEFLSVRW